MIFTLINETKKWFKGDNDFNKEDIDLLQSDKKLSNICP